MVYIVNISLRVQVNLSTILTHAVVKILMYGERMINKYSYSYSYSYFPYCLWKHRRLYIYYENLEKVHLLKKEETHWASSISESAKEFGWDYEKILMESENTS